MGRLNNLVPTSLVQETHGHSSPHCVLRQSESYQCSSLIWQMPLTNVLWGGQQQREDLENITKNKSPILDRHLFLFHFFPPSLSLLFFLHWHWDTWGDNVSAESWSWKFGCFPGSQDVVVRSWVDGDCAAFTLYEHTCTLYMFMDTRVWTHG